MGKPQPCGRRVSLLLADTSPGLPPRSSRAASRLLAASSAGCLCPSHPYCEESASRRLPALTLVVRGGYTHIFFKSIMFDHYLFQSENCLNRNRPICSSLDWLCRLSPAAAASLCCWLTPRPARSPTAIQSRRFTAAIAASSAGCLCPSHPYCEDSASRRLPALAIYLT